MEFAVWDVGHNVMVDIDKVQLLLHHIQIGGCTGVMLSNNARISIGRSALVAAIIFELVPQ